MFCVQRWLILSWVVGLTSSPILGRILRNDSGKGRTTRLSLGSIERPRKVSIFAWDENKAIRTGQHVQWIQLGLKHVLKDAPPTNRQPLIKDFSEEKVFSLIAIEEKSNNFDFHVIAPLAFQFIREMFGIDNESFRRSICDYPLCPHTKKGNSGSKFYITQDERFVFKTIGEKEETFLMQLMPKYIVNLSKNRRETLLPKYFGLYYSQAGFFSVRIVVMSNIMPKKVVDFQYDLKGSTYQRKTDVKPGETPHRPYKDQDFIKHYPHGLHLDYWTYKWVVDCIERDCLLLESFSLIDYSLLLGVQELTTGETRQLPDSDKPKSSITSSGPSWDVFNKIYARNTRGNQVVIYLGIIDILQSYTFRRKVERYLKSLYVTNESFSVATPEVYSRRFQDFIGDRIFKIIPYTKYCEKPAEDNGPLRIVEYKTRTGETWYRTESVEETGKLEETPKNSAS